MRTRAALAALLALGTGLSAQSTVRITAERFLAHVRWLSDDERAGRGNGEAGLERAADYVRDQFRAAGLSGAFSGSFDQPFSADVTLAPPASTTLRVEVGGAAHLLSLGRDFHPLSLIDRQPAEPPPAADTVPLVFAGYGISAPGLAYDDFSDVDVTGAAVLVFTHEPQEHDAASAFDGRNLTPGAALSQKAREARERGARLLLLVEDPSHADDRAMRSTWWSDPLSEGMGIPVLRVARDRLREVLPQLDLGRVAETIDRTLRPQSRRLDGVTIDYVEHRAQFTASVRNIVAIARGGDARLAGEAVVVGAHYDHVGAGGELSDTPDRTGEIHNGADDNASGVAALIEVARAVGARQRPLRRSVVFAAFAGEELGLRGSERYVEAPAVPLGSTRAMINLDMIGRARGRVLVGSFGPPWPGLSPARRVRAHFRLVIESFAAGGYPAEASDVGPFARRGVPSAAFFTGFHADYHRPSDDWPAIDAAGGAEIATMVLRLVEELAR